MKPRRADANDLPWLTPSAHSLRALARLPLMEVWPHLRRDPGLVYLVARAARRSSGLGLRSCDVRVLWSSLQYLQSTPQTGCVDWNQAYANTVYRTALTHAQLAVGLADLIPDCDENQVWIGGMAATLGWIVGCALDPHVAGRRTISQSSSGFDGAALARRVSNAWRLPRWVSAVAGHLALPAEYAVRLGADRTLFQVVQLAVLLQQREGDGPRLQVGAEIAELLAPLQLSGAQVEQVVDRVREEATPDWLWEPPACQPLLTDLLQLALRDRSRRQQAQLEQLHGDVDRLQEALATRHSEEHSRLQALKLAALAEFAAGAGHEINNPLAVISGQAQYLLKQLHVLDGPADEIDNPVEYLANLRGELAPSLQKIIGQTQRIHGILTELMQFARPAPPRVERVDAAEVIGETTLALTGFAQERQVRLRGEGPALPVSIHADPAQVRTALSALLRNAIEAAPAGGWACVRVEPSGTDRLALLVEDNGPGPGPVAQEHLFDPFYSGRIAGRGRGLGLPTAWRLARQQHGELRFDGTHDGVTRFRLLLPIASGTPVPAYVNGCNGAAHQHGNAPS
jgi:two-component system, NtrC family, sensor kinase